MVKFSTKSTCITILHSLQHLLHYIVGQYIPLPGPSSVCYKDKVLTAFESSSTYSATDPWWTICIFNSLTDHRCPLTLKNSTIWLRWSMFLNIWTVFTMEAIVLVSVLTSSVKIYDLGPLQDCYPARRRPTTFRYRNSVTKM